MTTGFTSAALGLFLFGGILLLVRRDRLHGGYAIWWLLVAVAALVIGFFPGLVDRLGGMLGVHYPPMLLAIVAIVAVLLKLLGIDIDVTRREQKMRRLLQKVAILELELNELRERLGPSVDTTPPDTGPRTED
jgi:hypothetical protein